MSSQFNPQLFDERTFSKNDGGEVKHFLKTNSEGFFGFGEAYFSSIEHGSIRGWKRHRRVSCNLSVLNGKVRFVLTSAGDQFIKYYLSSDDNKRLYIPPNFWFGFQGISSSLSLIINIIDEIHDPDEQDNLSLNHFDFDWKIS